MHHAPYEGVGSLVDTNLAATAFRVIHQPMLVMQCAYVSAPLHLIEQTNVSNHAAGFA